MAATAPSARTLPNARPIAVPRTPKNAASARNAARTWPRDAPRARRTPISPRRRTTDTAPRNSFDERNAFRVLAGVKGPAFANFNYEAYYMYARTRNANVQEGNISRSAFQAGLDGTGPVAINIFGRGSLTPEMGE